MTTPTPPPGSPRGALPRRAVLLGLGGALLGACTGAPPSGSSSEPGSSSASGSGRPSGSAAPSATPSGAALPSTTVWRPGPGEVRPEIKLRAVELVEAIGAWPPGQQGVEAARARVSALGLDPALAEQAAALLGPGTQAALQVVNAQYGGLLLDSASVMVVCRQWTAAPGGGTTAGGTTVDVRLRQASPRWNVTSLHPAEPGPPAADLSTAAQRVLAEPRIQLPPAAVADVRAGTVHDSVLESMLTLARSHTFAVTVLSSGHPLDVFGTTRPSDHPPGRAVDVWQIDGRAVVDPGTPHALVDDFMREAAATGSYNVGGPRRLSGGQAPNQFFSDETHRDHVHVGFRT
ncbi:hypothetical protein [Kitasatospora sp. NE20-6]|uniref:hypothetical protein n=1 Tax=Kitasatospora sp. NE20-6 TaxID=2859066 RepID=UPI0038B2D87F